jgi:hypothetical protein
MMNRTMVDENLVTATPTSLGELEQIVTDVGRSPWLWGHAIRFDPGRPSHRVLYKGQGLKVALFGWVTSQETLFHDHGGASGAVFVCSGLLIEDIVEAVDGHVIRQHTHARRAESAFSFGPDYIHRVRHDPLHGVALSIHAYTPEMSDAVDYDVRPDGTIRALSSVS